jgi:hypothetical protein
MMGQSPSRASITSGPAQQGPLGFAPDRRLEGGPARIQVGVDLDDEPVEEGVDVVGLPGPPEVEGLPLEGGELRGAYSYPCDLRPLPLRASLDFHSTSSG